MKPIIGVTCDTGQEKIFTLNESYVNAIIQAGGTPLIVPCHMGIDVVQLVNSLDGLLLTGGGDINPMLFGEEPHPRLGEISPTRDSLERALIHEMLRIDKPVLGICRGLQMLNIVLGGNMYQDIHAQCEQSLLQHSQKAPRDHRSHFIQVTKETMIFKIAQAHEFKVNSYHHQAVKDVFKPLIVSATATDGIIEAIESTEHRFVIGVQWHPEELAVKGDRISERLFERLIHESEDRRLEIEGH